MSKDEKPKNKKVEFEISKEFRSFPPPVNKAEPATPAPKPKKTEHVKE